MVIDALDPNPRLVPTFDDKCEALGKGPVLQSFDSSLGAVDFLVRCGWMAVRRNSLNGFVDFGGEFRGHGHGEYWVTKIYCMYVYEIFLQDLRRRRRPSIYEYSIEAVSSAPYSSQG